MSRKFKIGRDPHEYGFKIYKKGTIEIQSGLTVLVGCNGIGKTTLLNCISSSLDKDNIPCMKYNNLMDGGYNSRQENLWRGRMELLAQQACSSEGENININVINFSKDIMEFINTGSYPGDKKRLVMSIESILKSNPDENEELSKERWLIFDAVDSGLSVDNIVDMKEYLFSQIFKILMVRKFILLFLQMNMKWQAEKNVLMFIMVSM